MTPPEAVTTDGSIPDRRTTRAVVVESLPNAMFRLRREDGTELMAHVAGQLRMQFTRLLQGDLVDIEESPFDRGKARIQRLLQRGPARPTDQSVHQPRSESEP